MSAVREDRREGGREKEMQTGKSTIKLNELTFGRVLGKGSFGQVISGSCRGIEVAIKKLKSDPKKFLAFQKEVEMAKAAGHPNIAQYMGVCYDTECNYIVTELVKNGNLGALLKQTDIPLSLTVRLKMALDIAKGLAWLHNADPPIIHRDLKTDNLLVTERNGIKICDFGLAQLKENEFIVDKTNPIGTPYWMAPEVLAGLNVNQKSDIYSFGLILWCLVTRTHCPFTHYTKDTIFYHAIIHENERPPIPADVNPSLRQLIEVCWQTNPADRPIALAIAEQLKAIIIDHYIDDLHGREFWKTYFLNEQTVPWPEFMARLLNYLYQFDEKLHSSRLPENITIAQSRLVHASFLLEWAYRNPNRLELVESELDRRRTQNNILEDPRIISLHKVLVTIDNSDGLPLSKRENVSIANFGSLLKWFGPLVRENSHILLSQIHSIITSDWFDPDTPENIQAKLLAAGTVNISVVRFSRTIGCFSIDILESKNKIMHHRIERNAAGQFIWGKYATNTLEQLVSIIADQHKLIFVGSKGLPGQYIKGIDYVLAEQ